jgi:hypothetical protein
LIGLIIGQRLAVAEFELTGLERSKDLCADIDFAGDRRGGQACENGSEDGIADESHVQGPPDHCGTFKLSHDCPSVTAPLSR